jgi:hypothetical protein
MKKKNLLLLGLFLAVVATVKGDDLYVYGTNGSKQAFALDEVQNLTLSTDALVINFKSGNPISVAYSALNFFSLIDYAFTSIRPVEMPFCKQKKKKKDVNLRYKKCSKLQNPELWLEHKSPLSRLGLLLDAKKIIGVMFCRTATILVSLYLLKK